MNIAIRPTPIKDLNPGDVFRIAGFERDEDVVGITSYFGVGGLVNSIFLSPDDTLDKVIR